MTEISTQQIYELIDRKISEVNTSVIRLETKFDFLEQGRLSSLEKEFANLQGRMAIVAGIVSVVISLVFIAINFYLK